MSKGRERVQKFERERERKRKAEAKRAKRLSRRPTSNPSGEVLPPAPPSGPS